MEVQVVAAEGELPMLAIVPPWSIPRRFLEEIWLAGEGRCCG